MDARLDYPFRSKVENILEDPSLSRSCYCSRASPIRKIQRVQPYLRYRTEYEMYYSPKLLSIGPIHHGLQNLKLGEYYKQRWTRAYLEDLGEPVAAAQALLEIIASNIQDLSKLFSEDLNEKKDEFTWILFLDGCSILYVMNNAGNWDIETAGALEIKIDQLALLLQDMLLLENQLLYKLLVLLRGEEHKTKQSMLKLLQNHTMVRGPDTVNTNNDSHGITVGKEASPAHLLDLQHKTLVGTFTHLSRLRSGRPEGYRVRNIEELEAAGISVRRSKETSIQGVNWEPEGCLELPEIIVDIFTARTFMNLIAYEMCPDFPNTFEISSYVAILDSLIDPPSDVKDLRLADVLQNHLKNDKEVASLFNTISTRDLKADVSKCAHVQAQVEDYCKHHWQIWEWNGWVRKWNYWNWKCKKWITEVDRVHFRSPWTIIALIAGVLGLRLTIIQTWFTIWPVQQGHK